MDNKLIDNRSLGLDFIRFSAVILVLIAHFAKCLELFGFWGVELFFGLSGYLIGQILWRGYTRDENWNFNNIKIFWLRRWWRTLPNYFLFFLISFPFHYFIMGDKIPNTIKLIPFFFFGQNLFSRYGGFYGVSWSLCIEEWLYLLFPLLLFLFHKIVKVKVKAFSFALITIILGSVFMRIFLSNNGQAEYIRTITSCRLDSITYGIAIAFIESYCGISKKKKVIYFISGILLILAPVFTRIITDISFAELRQNQFLLVCVPVGSSIILPFVSSYKRIQNLSSNIKLIITNLSIWTYSIYLSHIPILFTIYYLLLNYRTNVYLNLISKIIGFAITVLISSLVYKYFELPLTRKRPKEIVN